MVANGSRGAMELPVNAFRGMTMSEAIKLLMKSVQRKQTTAEIAEGLKNGGLVSTAKDIMPTLRNALSVLKGQGVLLRFSDGWDLAEAHSAMIRHRITKGESSKSKKRGTATAKGKRSQPSKPKQPARPKAENAAPTLDARAFQFLQTHPTQTFTAKQIAEALSVPDATKLNLPLSRLVRFKKALKDSDGRYLVRAA